MVELRPEFPVISFTFDDFPQSAYREGGVILRRHGILGTYYVALGLMDRQIPAGPAFSLDDVKRVLDEGHELGCHTFTHCHSWETEPKVFEESVIENRKSLEKFIPGAAFKSLSYPIAWPRPQTKRRVAKYFACCRGGGTTFNIGQTDASNLQALFLEKNMHNPDALKRLIEDNAHARGWLILATHDVNESPSPFGCTPAFLDDIVRCAVNSGARILPVAQAWANVAK